MLSPLLVILPVLDILLVIIILSTTLLLHHVYHKLVVFTIVMIVLIIIIIVDWGRIYYPLELKLSSNKEGSFGVELVAVMQGRHRQLSLHHFTLLCIQCHFIILLYLKFRESVLL